MVRPAALVIPTGVRLHAGRKGVSVEHTGDILLEAAPGGDLERVISREGSVTLRGRLRIDRVEAPNGTVLVEGPLQADHVLADVVEIAASAFQARAVRGRRRIVVGPVRVNVDVLMAPHIEIDPKATGRAPIVESHNDPGPNGIKGGFSVAEYGDLLGDAVKFLADRGLEPLEPPPSTAEVPTASPPAPEVPTAPPPAPEPPVARPRGRPADRMPADDATTGENVEDPDTSPARPVTRSPDVECHDFVVLGEPVVEPEAWDEAAVEFVPEEPSGHHDGPSPEEQALWEAPDAPLVVIEDDQDSSSHAPEVEDLALPPGAHHHRRHDPGHDVAMEALPASEADASDAFPSSLDDEAFDPAGMLHQTIRDLRRFYPPDGEPPPITALAAMVNEGRYDEIADRLPFLWNELVNHHRDHGIRIRRQVTTTFNDILGIVKRTPPVKLVP